MRRAKITIVGAGNVGRDDGPLVCRRRVGGHRRCWTFPTRGGGPRQVLDLFQASPIMGFDAKIVGTADYRIPPIATSSSSRRASHKPGMSRDDLLSTNAKIVGASPSK